jgi:hypothetical protein
MGEALAEANERLLEKELARSRWARLRKREAPTPDGCLG